MTRRPDIYDLLTVTLIVLALVLAWAAWDTWRLR